MTTDKDKFLEHWRPLVLELGKRAVLDIGDSEAGANLMRGLTMTFRKNVAQALRMLLTDSKSKSEPFRNVLVRAVTIALNLAYGGSLDENSTMERFLVVYPLVCKAVAEKIEKARPDGWRDIRLELGVDGNPIEALGKPAQVVVTLNSTNRQQRDRVLGRISAIYS